MHDLGEKYFMMIHPEPSGKLINLASPNFVQKGRELFAIATEKARYRGYHVCYCGERSDNIQWVLPNGVETNSLMVHYLEKHLVQVPLGEIQKLLDLHEELIGQTGNP